MKVLAMFLTVGCALLAFAKTTFANTTFARQTDQAQPFINVDQASMLSPNELIGQLREGGLGLLIRHTSTTEGLGEPDNFSLSDCSTQRNLSAAGRTEATQMGVALRKHKVYVDDVLTSPWCRTRETARLAFNRSTDFMPISALPSQTKTSDIAMLLRSHKGKVDRFGKLGNLALVTHNDNIKLLTGLSVNQGDIVIVKNDQGALAVKGVLRLKDLLQINPPVVLPAHLRPTSATPSQTAVEGNITRAFAFDQSMIGSCSGIDFKKLSIKMGKQQEPPRARQ
jgi:phosphohistidine phosphatase SixA